MKYALCIVALVATLSFAGSEFATGGELFKFSGYNKFRFGINGMEGVNPENSFDFYNYTQWSPRINEMLSARVSFDTKYGYYNDFTLKLADLFLSMNITEDVALTGGRFKLPFGYAFYRSGSSIPFFSRAMITFPVTDFAPYGGRDIGAMLSADFGPAGIDLAFTNGTNGIADDSSYKKQFTARLHGSPIECLELGAAVAMIGMPTHDVIIDDTTTVTIDEWSATGINFFLTVHKPVSETVTLDFEGEYFILPVQTAEVTGYPNENGSDYYAALAATFDVDMGIINAVQPAIRYETYSPSYVGDTDPEDDETVIDFCINLHTGNMNYFQIGGQNFSYEDSDFEGITDMYIAWRMKF